MLPGVFYDSQMTSQMQVVRTNTCLKQKKNKQKPTKPKNLKLIIATINNSNIPLLQIIKFTNAKTLLLIG